MSVILEREPVTITTFTDDDGPESFIAAILGLVIIAMLGFMIYAFQFNSSTLAPDRNLPTAALPLAAPQMPAPEPPPLVR